MTNIPAPYKLTLPASGTILTASAIAADLLSACAAHQHILLDVEAVTQADLSFAQLVYAARQHQSQQGGSLALARPAGEALAALLTASGISSDDSDADFWFKGASSQ